MNQILQVQENRSKYKNRSTSNPVDTKKIVLFFAAALIIFGIILLGQGVYTVYQNNKNKKVEPPVVEQPVYVPTITLTKTEENKVILNVQSEIAISHIIYDWNSQAAETLDETGKTNIEEIIDIPVGENTLNISIIDSNGTETKKSEKYIVEVKKPVIELSVVGNNIKISVTSEVELSYVTYKWNLEQEEKIDMTTFEDKTKFEKEIPILTGQNTLLVTAVDIYGNKSEESQKIKGVPQPKTSPVIQGDQIFFEITAEEDIIKVEYTFNGETNSISKEQLAQTGQTRRVTYRMKLVEGWNYLKIKTTTESGAMGEDIWKYEYKK